MTEYQVLQEYQFVEGQRELVCLPFKKHMMFQDVYPKNPQIHENLICKAVASPVRVYACIRDSKIGKPYIKWEKPKTNEHGQTYQHIYILWPQSNAFYKILDYVHLPLSQEYYDRIVQLVNTSKEQPPIAECINGVDAINARMQRLKTMNI